MSLILPAALFNAFGVFLMRQFIAGLPDELEEAAIIDGASVPQIFFRIIIPLVKPSMAAFGIFVFLGQWNSFMYPLIFLNKTETFTVPLLLNFFKGTYATDYPLLMAGTVISVVPVLIVYLFFKTDYTGNCNYWYEKLKNRADHRETINFAVTCFIFSLKIYSFREESAESGSG